MVGRFQPVHAFLLEQILAKIDYLDEALERLTAEIDRRVAPFEPTLTALDTIPGIDRIGAISLVAETGGDMARFPSAPQLCSWAGMCPGHNESAGKRRSGKTRKAMRDGVTYRELGADYCQRRDRERTARRHVKQLEALGYVVTVQPPA